MFLFLLLFFVVSRFLYAQEPVGIINPSLSLYSLARQKTSFPVKIAVVKDSINYYPSESEAELNEKFESREIAELLIVLGIMQQYDRSRITLPNDVNLFKIRIDRVFKKPVGIEHLLTYSSGFEEVILREPDSDKIQFPLKRFFVPGELIGYEENSILILQKIIETLEGSSFSEYSNERILIPFGITGVSFAGRNAELNLLQVSQILNQFLNPETLEIKEILKSAVWKEMIQTRFRMDEKLPGSTPGFFEEIRNGKRCIYRIYDSRKSSGIIYFLPEENTGLFILIEGYAPRVKWEMVQAFMDQTFPVAEKKFTIDESEENTKYLKNMTGEYVLAQASSAGVFKVYHYLKSITVKADSGTLSIRGPEDEIYGNLSGESEFSEMDPFLFKQKDGEGLVHFHLDDNGNVTHLASGNGYHGTYRKLKWYETSFFHTAFGVSIISMSALLFLLGLFSVLKNFISKREDVPPYRTVFLRIFFTGSNFVQVLFIAGYIRFISSIREMKGVSILFVPGIELYLLFLLPLIILIGMSFFLYIYFRALFDKQIKPVLAIIYFISISNSVVYLYFLNFWNLIGFNFY